MSRPLQGTYLFVLLAAAATMQGCDSGKSDAAAPQMTEDDGLRAALDVLVSYQASNDVHHYDEPIRQLRRLLCPKGPCEGDAHADGARRYVVSIALTYAHSSTPAVREFATAVACGICGEALTGCTCERRTCTSTDFAPRHSHHNTTLECGRTIIDGTVYTWGQAVKDLP